MEKRDMMLMHELGQAVARVETGMAGAAALFALQVHPTARSTPAARSTVLLQSAYLWAEILEREARNIRAAIDNHQGGHSTPPTPPVKGEER